VEDLGLQICDLLYGDDLSQIDQSLEQGGLNQSFLIYGPQNIGKSWVASNIRQVLKMIGPNTLVEQVDFQAISPFVKEMQGLKAAERYLKMLYNRVLTLAQKSGRPAVLVLDNINSLCAAVNEQDEGA